MPPALGPFGAIGRVSGSWALVIMAISLIDANTFNAYSGAFQILAFGSMWRRFRTESVTVRLAPFLCVMAAGVVTACLGAPGRPHAGTNRRLPGAIPAAEALREAAPRRLTTPGLAVA